MRPRRRPRATGAASGVAGWIQTPDSLRLVLSRVDERAAVRRPQVMLCAYCSKNCEVLAAELEARHEAPGRERRSPPSHTPHRNQRRSAVTSGTIDSNLVAARAPEERRRVLARHAIDRSGLPIDHGERDHQRRPVPDDLVRDAPAVGTHDERDRPVEPRERSRVDPCQVVRDEPLPASAPRHVDQGPPVRGPDRSAEPSRAIADGCERAVDREPVEPVASDVHEQLLPCGAQTSRTGCRRRSVRSCSPPRPRGRARCRPTPTRRGRRSATTSDPRTGRTARRRRGCRCGRVPSAAAVMTSADVPSASSPTHAMRVPSGDHVGCRTSVDRGVGYGDEGRIRSVGLEHRERPACVQHGDATGRAGNAGRLRRGRRARLDRRPAGASPPAAPQRERASRRHDEGHRDEGEQSAIGERSHVGLDGSHRSPAWQGAKAPTSGPGRAPDMVALAREGRMSEQRRSERRAGLDHGRRGDRRRRGGPRDLVRRARVRRLPRVLPGRRHRPVPGGGRDHARDPRVEGGTRGVVGSVQDAAAPSSRSSPRPPPWTPSAASTGRSSPSSRATMS